MTENNKQRTSRTTTYSFFASAILRNSSVTPIVADNCPILTRNLLGCKRATGTVEHRLGVEEHFSPSSDAVPLMCRTKYILLLGRFRRQALSYHEILACLIEICQKKRIWTPCNCQKTTYYLVRHMRGTAPELGLI